MPSKSTLVQLVPQGVSLCPSFPPSAMSHGGIVSSSFPSSHLAPIRQEKCVEMRGAVCDFQQLELPCSAPKVVEFQSIWACGAHSHSAHLHLMPPKIFWCCLCARVPMGNGRGPGRGSGSPEETFPAPVGIFSQTFPPLPGHFVLFLGSAVDCQQQFSSSIDWCLAFHPRAMEKHRDTELVFRTDPNLP